MVDTQQQSGERLGSPIVENSFILEGNSRGVVSMSWICNTKSDPRTSHHLLTEVDLIPDEVPRIDIAQPWSVPLGSGSPWRVYSEQWPVASTELLQWFDQLVGTGNWSPPWRTPLLTSPTLLEDLLNEPRWPYAVHLDDATAVPFAARRGTGTRMHHMLCAAPKVQGVLDESERQVLFSQFNERHGINFAQLPELLQSAHFFQRMPVLRNISSRLEAPDDEGDKAILIDLVPRRGASLSEVSLQLFEERPTGNRLLSTIHPTANFYRIPVNEQVQSISLRALHDRFGLLLEEGPYTFIRGFSLSVGLVGGERRVKQPARHGRPAYVQRIPITTFDNNTTTTSDPERSAAQVLHSLKHRLKTTSGAREKQRWFRGDIREAEEAIQKVLASAKNRAMVVDPYFSAADVDVWLPSVAARNAEVQVLTSKAGLRQVKIDGLKNAPLEKEHLERLRAKLGVPARDLNPTTLRIMHGDQSPIHDRFIVVDDKVWLLGSSLNTFGKHGTMFVELPLPAEVLAEIEKIWKQESDSLEVRLGQLESGEPEVS